MKTRIYLNKAKQRNVLGGHPWIFPKAIQSIDGAVNTGDLVDIFDSEKQWIAVGIYNHHSLYQVRVLAFAWEVNAQDDLKAIVTLRLKQALMLRKGLGLPSALTNAYRLFNSEADGLSGLTIDLFNTVYVVSSSAYWVEAHQAMISSLIKTIFKADSVLWRAQTKPLAQDGWKQPTVNPTEDFTTDILEHGVKFSINFSTSQKTGLFLDQRDNHIRIGALAKGKRVLDLYTYTGGFALHAAANGASKVTAIDSSEPAIDQAKKNASMNHLQINFIAADAREYLTKAGDYDLIILDPPKLVPSRTHLTQAKKHYRFLHRELFKNMQSGALLMTCNCSSALSTPDFCQLIHAQALALNRRIRVLGIYGPAVCHPTTIGFPEGNYLAAVLVVID